MAIRDEELKRLEKYAQGLNTKVTYKQYKRGGGSGAEWLISEDSSTELILYIWPNQSKTTLILNFVHELAHHMSHIYRNRKETQKTLNAFSKQDEKDISKEERKIVYLSEKEDAQYRRNIWQEVDIKIPLWKLEVDIILDIWEYKMYYLRGKHPTQEEMKIKRKKIEKQIRGENGT